MWTDERVELLRAYWAEGISTSKIALKIGGCTKNSVIGKAHRLGLSGRGPRQYFGGMTQIRTPRARIERPRIVKRKKIHDRPPSQDYQPIAGGVSLIDLEKHQCRFPVTGDDTARHLFCGGTKLDGLSYCEHHARIAYQPAPVRKPSLFVDRRLHRAFA